MIRSAMRSIDGLRLYVAVRCDDCGAEQELSLPAKAKRGGAWTCVCLARGYVRPPEAQRVLWKV